MWIQESQGKRESFQEEASVIVWKLLTRQGGWEWQSPSGSGVVVKVQMQSYEKQLNDEQMETLRYLAVKEG